MGIPQDAHFSFQVTALFTTCVAHRIMLLVLLLGEAQIKVFSDQSDLSIAQMEDEAGRVFSGILQKVQHWLHEDLAFLRTNVKLVGSDSLMMQAMQMLQISSTNSTFLYGKKYI
jgi:hypothetical protein